MAVRAWHTQYVYTELYEELLYKGLKKDVDKIDLLELLIEDFDNKTILEIGIPEKNESCRTFSLLTRRK